MAKLTLSVDREVIDKAKRLAGERGVSVSSIFSRYIESMSDSSSPRRRPAPITGRVRGLAKVSAGQSDRELYEAAIAAKARQ